MNRLEIVNNISTNIERERIKLGMSQAQFAKHLICHSPPTSG